MTTGLKSAILTPALFERRYGGIAQLARARGSYPRCHWFKSSCRYQQNTDFIRFHIDKRPGGQAVKTPPFHGGNTGSSPVRVTTFSQPFIWRHSSAGRASASHAEGHRFEFCCLHQNKKQLRKQLLFVLLCGLQQIRPQLSCIAFIKKGRHNFCCVFLFILLRKIRRRSPLIGSHCPGSPENNIRKEPDHSKRHRDSCRA